MQTIITKYHGPTNTRPSRITATATGGLKATVTLDYNGREIDDHIRAIRAVCEKAGWYGEFIIGGTQGGYVAVFAKDERFTVER